jgi:hypothetical protein
MLKNISLENVEANDNDFAMFVNSVKKMSQRYPKRGKCFNCGMTGHFQKDCKRPEQKEQESNEEEEKERVPKRRFFKKKKNDEKNKGKRAKNEDDKKKKKMKKKAYLVVDW